MSIREWLIPQEKIFFDFLEKQIVNVAKGIKVLYELPQNFKDIPTVYRKIKKIEHDGDTIVHDFYQKLNHTFITPLDHEDLTLLVSLFDDILDNCYAVTNRLYFYKIDELTPELKRFFFLITKQIVQLENTIKRIRKMEQKEIDRYCIEIHRLENLGDHLFDKALANLFEKENDVKKIVKLKEIYKLLEETLDLCEDAAIAIRGIVIKNI